MQSPPSVRDGGGDGACADPRRAVHLARVRALQGACRTVSFESLKILGRIGDGSQGGCVLRARTGRGSGEDIAVKVLYTHSGRTTFQRKLLATEHAVLESLLLPHNCEAPHVAHIVGAIVFEPLTKDMFDQLPEHVQPSVVTYKRTCALLFELLDGPLSAYLQHGLPPTRARAARHDAALQVLDAMLDLQRRGIVNLALGFKNLLVKHRCRPTGGRSSTSPASAPRLAGSGSGGSGGGAAGGAAGGVAEQEQLLQATDGAVEDEHGGDEDNDPFALPTVHLADFSQARKVVAAGPAASAAERSNLSHDQLLADGLLLTVFRSTAAAALSNHDEDGVCMVAPEVLRQLHIATRSLRDAQSSYTVDLSRQNAFAAGVLLYQVATGAHPFPSYPFCLDIEATDAAALQAPGWVAPLPPLAAAQLTALTAAVGPAYAGVVARLLSPDPGARLRLEEARPLLATAVEVGVLHRRRRRHAEVALRRWLDSHGFGDGGRCSDHDDVEYVADVRLCAPALVDVLRFPRRAARPPATLAPAAAAAAISGGGGGGGAAAVAFVGVDEATDSELDDVARFVPPQAAREVVLAARGATGEGGEGPDGAPAAEAEEAADGLATALQRYQAPQLNQAALAFLDEFVEQGREMQQLVSHLHRFWTQPAWDKFNLEEHTHVASIRLLRQAIQAMSTVTDVPPPLPRDAAAGPAFPHDDGVVPADRGNGVRRLRAAAAAAAGQSSAAHGGGGGAEAGQLVGTQELLTGLLEKQPHVAVEEALHTLHVCFAYRRAGNQYAQMFRSGLGKFVSELEDGVFMRRVPRHVPKAIANAVEDFHDLSGGKTLREVSGKPVEVFRIERELIKNLTAEVARDPWVNRELVAEAGELLSKCDGIVASTLDSIPVPAKSFNLRVSVGSTSRSAARAVALYADVQGVTWGVKIDGTMQMTHRTWADYDTELPQRLGGNTVCLVHRAGFNADDAFLHLPSESAARNVFLHLRACQEARAKLDRATMQEGTASFRHRGRLIGGDGSGPAQAKAGPRPGHL